MCWQIWPKCVQVIRGASFRSDFLQNTYFSCTSSIEGCLHGRCLEWQWCVYCRDQLGLHRNVYFRWITFDTKVKKWSLSRFDRQWCPISWAAGNQVASSHVEWGFVTTVQLTQWEGVDVKLGQSRQIWKRVWVTSTIFQLPTGSCQNNEGVFLHLIWFNKLYCLDGYKCWFWSGQ